MDRLTFSGHIHNAQTEKFSLFHFPCEIFQHVPDELELFFFFADIRGAQRMNVFETSSSATLRFTSVVLIEMSQPRQNLQLLKF